MAFVSSSGLNVVVPSTVMSSKCSSWIHNSNKTASGTMRVRASVVAAVAKKSSIQMHHEDCSNEYVKPVLPILMGSASDLDRCKKIAAAAVELGLSPEMRVASAHKVPSRLLEVIDKYENDPRPKVYISVAGRSNALSGMLDCAVSAPVIACPPYSDAFGGGDVYSSIRMPGGVAPMLVLDPEGAALAAAKILGVNDERVRAKVEQLQKRNRDRLYVDDVEQLQKRNRDRLYVDDAELSSKSFIDSYPEGTQTCIVDTDGILDESKIKEARKGKVRDQYEINNDDRLVLVTTDRQSAFDRLLAEIPFKGAVLNMVSQWWFTNTEHIIPNHVLSCPHPNVTLARKCTPFPIEFVVRGYITGSTSTSLWKNYSSGVRTYCGITFPEGLKKNQKLEVNVLTPTTKGEVDRPISPAEIIAEGWMTKEDYEVCAKAAMELFAFGQQKAAEHGLILVDTKYEFGKDKDGVIRVIDEMHTPDSSRFWLATSYESRIAAGKEPENIDKEFLRLWFVDKCDPYKDPVLPQAPPELVNELSRRYVMLYELITWQSFHLNMPSSIEAIRSALQAVL